MLCWKLLLICYYVAFRNVLCELQASALHIRLCLVTAVGRVVFPRQSVWDVCKDLSPIIMCTEWRTYIFLDLRMSSHFSVQTINCVACTPAPLKITLGIWRLSYLWASVRPLVNTFITHLSCSTFIYIYIFTQSSRRNTSLPRTWVLTYARIKVSHLKRLKSSEAQCVHTEISNNTPVSPSNDFSEMHHTLTKEKIQL